LIFGNAMQGGQQTHSGIWGGCRPSLAVLLLAAGLGGCGGGFSQATVSSTMVTPGKYEFHSCQAIETDLRGRRARQAVLEQLMAKASEDAGGGVVSAITYRPEYLANQGEIAELIKTTANKNCTVQSPFSSGRAVF
jgi:hypothetical protein